MNRFFTATSLVGLFGLGACATPSYQYMPTVQEVSRPPLGSVSTVGVGEQMLVQGRFVEREALQLDREVRVGTIGTYTFTPGHYVRVGGTGSTGFYNQSPIAGVTILNLKACTSAPEARMTTVSSAGDNSFQQTLIYSGRVGDKVNIGYREFSSNVARPAFNNDVEYDLSESDTIGYRGAELQILEATNRSITYRVIRNFNAAVQ